MFTFTNNANYDNSIKVFELWTNHVGRPEFLYIDDITGDMMLNHAILTDWVSVQPNPTSETWFTLFVTLFNGINYQFIHPGIWFRAETLINSSWYVGGYTIK